jgi:cytochrome c553
MKTITVIAVGGLLAVAFGAAVAQSKAEVPALATGVCAACHGPQGRSVSPVFPNLAGQQSAYITLQLDAFRGRLRADPLAQAYMWGMASQLTDDAIKSLSDYYSAQQPMPGETGDPALLAQGQKIYTLGIPAINVQACATCHGQKAEGAAAFPRLAGQHVDYLIGQLEGFHSGTRANAPIMQAVAHDMSPEQMKAVATYAASR